MTIKNHNSLLVGIFASLGFLLAQPANASTDLGTLTATGTNFNDLNVPGGTSSFTDSYTFTVDSASILAGSLTYSFSSDAYSVTPPPTSAPFATLNSGLTLSKVEILNGGTVVGTGVFNGSITPVSVLTIPLPPPTFGFEYDTKTTTVETVSLNNIFLVTGKTYTLEIFGSATGVPTAYFGYTGNLAAISSPVTEPKEWALILLGLPFIGFVTHRQRNRRELAIRQ